MEQLINSDIGLLKGIKTFKFYAEYIEFNILIFRNKRKIQKIKTEIDLSLGGSKAFDNLILDVMKNMKVRNIYLADDKLGKRLFENDYNYCGLDMLGFSYVNINNNAYQDYQKHSTNNDHLTKSL